MHTFTISCSTRRRNDDDLKPTIQFATIPETVYRAEPGKRKRGKKKRNFHAFRTRICKVCNRSGARHARWPLRWYREKKCYIGERMISLSNLVVQRTSCERSCLCLKGLIVKRIDRATCKKISRIAKLDRYTRFFNRTRLSTASFQLFMLVANIFFRPLLARNHATMREQGFLSFVRT